MGPGSFKRAIWDLSTYFERKLASDETISQWLNQVQDISELYLPDIISEIKKFEAWPRNLPAVIRSVAAMIQEQKGTNQYAIHDRRFHPDRWANKECQKCHGAGIVRTRMDWPMGRTEEGVLITKRINPPVLCSCTDKWEAGG